MTSTRSASASTLSDATVGKNTALIFNSEQHDWPHQRDADQHVGYLHPGNRARMGSATGTTTVRLTSTTGTSSTYVEQLAGMQ